MKTHYIEGTDEQYSIREDGITIRHYKKTNKGIRNYEDFIKKNYLRHDKRKVSRSPLLITMIKGKSLVVKALMAKYFNIKGPESGRKFELSYMDNNPANCHIDNLYYINHKTKKEHDSLSKDKSRKDITRWYVSSKLNISVKDLSENTYNLYKAKLKVKRLLSEKTGVPTNLISKYYG